MAEKRQQSGVFQNQWLNPAPTQINPQTGPYEMGGYQTDAFGRRYPTPGIERVSRGDRGQPFAGATQHYGHTGAQHTAAQSPPGMLGYANDIYNLEIPSLLDDESRAYIARRQENASNPPTAASRRNFDENIKPIGQPQPQKDRGLEMEHMGSMGSLEDVQAAADAAAPKNPWASELEGAHPELLKQTHDFYETPQADTTLGERAGLAGIQGAAALGKGIKGGLGYGRSLINAALYGNKENMGADRKDFLQQGGKALGKGANFMQRLLLGSPDAPADPMQQSGTTPETDAMYQQGMEDNPWLNQEGDSQAATDAWWDNQEYGQKVGGASGSPYLSTIGGVLSGGRDILKKGADWWWGDEMRGR